MTKVRVRFAPSPTGLQHLGNLRTALFNWLWAKKNNGIFILRFEDTDTKRKVAVAETHIFEALEWLGLAPDEGPQQGGKHQPYRQSERLDTYAQHSEQLVKEGRMYRDWTSPVELAKLRAQSEKAKQPFRVRPDMLKTEGDPKQPHVLRFKIDTAGQTQWEDAVHGLQTWQNSELDDFVAIKSDGYPTYNFANVIDDHLMEISHVLRGDEFLASTPKHLQVYAAFGWESPEYSHLPAVLGTDKAKLSKRHGALPALEYKKLGYLPEAIINFLVLLGWHPGTEEEIFTIDQLKKVFSLDKTNKSPGVFDPERLNWLNGIYIRKLSVGDLFGKVDTFWPPQAVKFDAKYKESVLKLVHERLRYLSELADLTDFFFTDPKLDSKLLAKQAEPNSVKDWLVETIKILGSSDFSQAELEHRLRKLTEELGVKPGKLFQSIRIAITGKTAAPGLFETLAVIGKERTLSRLDRAVGIL